MRTRIQKWGNSLALRIPRSFAVEIGLEQDSPVELSLEGEKLVVLPTRESKATLDGLLDQVTDDNLHHEFDTGPGIRERNMVISKAYTPQGLPRSRSDRPVRVYVTHFSKVGSLQGRNLKKLTSFLTVRAISRLQSTGSRSSGPIRAGKKRKRAFRENTERSGKSPQSSKKTKGLIPKPVSMWSYRAEIIRKGFSIVIPSMT